MPLTTSQLLTFKTAINNSVDGAIVAARAAGEHGVIVEYYNAPGTGFVWRPRVEAGELATVIDWAAFATVTVQKQNTYVAMVQGQRPLDATAPKVRGGFQTVFGAGATLDALILLAQRVPTRFEALFTTANVCAVFGQQVSVADVAEAMGST